MTKRVPLKFEFDAKTPSSIAEFNASDVVGPSNGGTGVSSLALLGIALSSIDVSSASVSATTISSPTFTGGTFTGSVVSATDMAGITFASPGGGDLSSLYFTRDPGGTYPNLIKAREGALTLMAEKVIALRTNSGKAHARFVPAAEVELYYDDVKKLETHNAGVVVTGGVSATSVSATDVSAVSLVIEKASATGMPIPAPYGFVQMTTDGTATDTEQNVGIGCITGRTESSTDDLEWDDTNKRWDVKKTGEYEITLSVVLTVAATTTVTLQLYSTSPGSSKLSADARVHSSIDPHIYTVSWIGTIAGGGYAFATTVDDGGTDITVNIGTVITVKRLK